MYATIFLQLYSIRVLHYSVLSADRRIGILRGSRGQRVLLIRVLLIGGTFFLLILVRFHVLRQVIAPHEPFAARRTGEPLLAGVSPKMTLQFVAPGEPFAAEQPVADERSFPGMPPEMRLQMGGFAVHFAASRHVAYVLSLPVHPELGPAVRLAIRAPTSRALSSRFPRILRG